MDNESTKESAAPTSPQPVAPREAAIVDGRAVTFEWEPVDAASAYLLEVSNDASFESVVFEKELAADQTALTVADFFPTDEQTFFWRVLAKDGGEWSRGERIESFVSGTREDVAKRIRTPDEEESVGPIEGLMQSATESVADEVSGREGEPPQEDRLQQERERGVAYEGVPSAQILGISIAILFAVAIIVILLFQWTSLTAMTVRETTINPDDYVLLRQTESDASRKLSQYEAGEEEGTYRIPIDQAMDLIVNEGYEQEGRTYSSEAPFVQQSEQ